MHSSVCVFPTPAVEDADDVFWAQRKEYHPVEPNTKTATSMKTGGDVSSSKTKTTQSASVSASSSATQSPEMKGRAPPPSPPVLRSPAPPKLSTPPSKDGGDSERGSGRQKPPAKGKSNNKKVAEALVELADFSSTSAVAEDPLNPLAAGPLSPGASAEGDCNSSPRLTSFHHLPLGPPPPPPIRQSLPMENPSFPPPQAVVPSASTQPAAVTSMWSSEAADAFPLRSFSKLPASGASRTVNPPPAARK